MNDHSLIHVRDAVLLRDLARLVHQERVSLAYLLAVMGEVDARHLYAPAGYSSMHAYCVNELRFSDDAAFKRIRAARAARTFPMLFLALADGRLHLTAVCLLAPHLTIENVEEFVQAATHRRQPEIEAMLARRLSLPPAPMRDRAIVRAIPPVTPISTPQLAVRPVDWLTPESTGDTHNAPITTSCAAEDGANSPPNGQSASCPDTDSTEIGPTLSTPAPPYERYLVKLTVEKSVHDKLRYAQTLLSHAVPSGNLAQVLDRALDTLIEELERRKFGVVRRRARPP
ncbi:MAG TPA: hypothetical protein VFP58_11825 [Candidatus Eisenbacteria bacterium]|nr:hypothetical protein [Candidatus Eisenbacteria bacterium]